MLFVTHSIDEALVLSDRIFVFTPGPDASNQSSIRLWPPCAPAAMRAPIPILDPVARNSGACCGAPVREGRSGPEATVLAIASDPLRSPHAPALLGSAVTAEVVIFRDGGYRYIEAVFQYSGGVAAERGFEIERVRLARLLPLGEGFAAIEAHLQALGRPLTSLCACELRSPAPFTEAGFTQFNRQYVETLERWGICRDRSNPVARTNVCPAFAPPDVPSLFAFSYTVPAIAAQRGSFVIAGSAEAQEGGASYRDSIVRLGDTSPAGLREKLRYVINEMERRLAALGFRGATRSQRKLIRSTISALSSATRSSGEAPRPAASHGTSAAHRWSISIWRWTRGRRRASGFYDRHAQGISLRGPAHRVRRRRREGLAFQRERLSLSAAGRRVRIRSASACPTASTIRRRARRCTTASSTSG